MRQFRNGRKRFVVESYLLLGIFLTNGILVQSAPEENETEDEDFSKHKSVNESRNESNLLINRESNFFPNINHLKLLDRKAIDRLNEQFWRHERTSDASIPNNENLSTNNKGITSKSSLMADNVLTDPLHKTLFNKYWGSNSWLFGKRNMELNDNGVYHKRGLEPYWVTRGKKDETPGFWMVRGRRNNDINYWASRGKKYDDAYQSLEPEVLSSEQQKYWASRGKKGGKLTEADPQEAKTSSHDQQYWESSGKKNNDASSFLWATRGRRNELEKYWPARGRRTDDNEDAFWVVRGKRSNKPRGSLNKGQLKLAKKMKDFWAARG